MRRATLASDSAEAKRAADEVFTRWPVLVEVRFPRSGTSPDWYLFEESEQFDALVAKLAPGAELFLISVWDLKQGTVALHTVGGDAIRSAGS